MTQAPAAPPTAALQRFQELLRELLQLDLADLDFGIYRLLHARRADVEAFLGKELPAQVDGAFAGMASADRDVAEAALERLASRAREAFGDEASLRSGSSPARTMRC